ncbi:DNA-processing protein DprA [Amycolatopsis thermoflava]
MISGLPRGIDTAAHTPALEARGRTVAVIGTGILGSCPPEDQDLQSRIAEAGLVLSQFWPDAPPSKHSFPMRNAVMSGYGSATIVVAAGVHSGARIQARQAVAHDLPWTRPGSSVGSAASTADRPHRLDRPRRH